jgi:hypothetical protein
MPFTPDYGEAGQAAADQIATRFGGTAAPKPSPSPAASPMTTGNVTSSMHDVSSLADDQAQLDAQKAQKQQRKQDTRGGPSKGSPKNETFSSLEGGASGQSQEGLGQ